MLRKPHRILLFSLLLVALLTPITSGDDCACLDAPDAPCVLHWLVLEEIVIPCRAWNGSEYVRSHFHEELDEAGDSEAWIIIQVDPIGTCAYACQQIYVWYEPSIAVSSNQDIRLVPRGLAGSTIFSMQECTPPSGYSIRFALVEEDESYSSVFSRVSRLVSARTGSTSPWVAETDAWSTNSLAADNSIDLIWEALTSGTSNDAILGISALSAPDLDPYLPTLHDRMSVLYASEGSGQIRISLHAYSTERPGVAGCTVEEAAEPTQAERHLASETLDTASSAATTSPSGRTVHTVGAAGIPPGASKMTTINRSSTHRGSSGTTTFTEKVVHLEFPDYSDYIFWESVVEERDPDGTVRRRVVSRGDGAGRAGAERARVRGEHIDISELRRTYRLRGFTPGNVYTMPASIAPVEGEPAYDDVEIAVPRGSTLDLSAVAAAQPAAALFGAADGGIAANRTITLRADHVLLPEGVAFADLFDPLPIVEPAHEVVELQVVDPWVLSSGDEHAFVPLVNLSGEEHIVTVEWTDTRGWTTPAMRSVFLPSGGVALIEVPLLIPETAATLGQSSRLSFTISGPGLAEAAVDVQLWAGVPTDTLVVPTVEPEPAEEAQPADESDEDATTSPEEDDETPPPSTDPAGDVTAPEDEEEEGEEEPTPPSTDPTGDVNPPGE